MPTKAKMHRSSHRNEGLPSEAPASTTLTTDASAPKVTYAVVMEKLIKAKNLDALDVAADWIGEVPDAEQRAELSAKYEELKAAAA